MLKLDKNDWNEKKNLASKWCLLYFDDIDLDKSWWRMVLKIALMTEILAWQKQKSCRGLTLTWTKILVLKIALIIGLTKTKKEDKTLQIKWKWHLADEGFDMIMKMIMKIQKFLHPLLPRKFPTHNWRTGAIGASMVWVHVSYTSTALAKGRASGGKRESKRKQGSWRKWCFREPANAMINQIVHPQIEYKFFFGNGYFITNPCNK